MKEYNLPMVALFKNSAFVSAFLAVTAAQLLKIVFSLLFTGKFSLRSAFSTGGMPSSHSAAVAAVTTATAVTEGIGSPLFAVSLVLSIVVVYDAVGIRRAAGRHAELLNEWSRILSEIYAHGFKPEDLKTLLGHTYPQVLAGILLGISTGFLVTFNR